MMKNFVDTDREYWDKLIELDFLGTLNCCKAAVRQMAKQKDGKIVNIISDAGRIGDPGLAVYSGVKAGIVGFSKALAKEVGLYKINVNCVSASVTTGTYLSEVRGTANPVTDEQRQRVRKMMKLYPLAGAINRLGLPSDIANTVVFLASDISEWITGQVMSVNGGYCMVD